jgi:hypothetical protein
MKDAIAKDDHGDRRRTYTGLLTVVTLAATLMVATPAFANSGFSISFFLSDGYYNDSRIHHVYRAPIYHDYWRGNFYVAPHRQYFGKRHIHKPWREHRHDRRHLHKHSRLPRFDHHRHRHNHIRSR